MAAALVRMVSRGGLSEKPNVLRWRRSIYTGVWWDLDSCKVPKGCDAHSIAGNIADALANCNYDGPITISAFANTYLIPLSLQHALSDSGVSLIHGAGDDPSDDYEYKRYQQIKSDMTSWAWHHPSAANCLIISNDVRFCLGLREENNILLAGPQKLLKAVKNVRPSETFDVPKTIWRWSSLREGGPPEWP